MNVWNPFDPCADPSALFLGVGFPTERSVYVGPSGMEIRDAFRSEHFYCFECGRELSPILGPPSDNPPHYYAPELYADQHIAATNHTVVREVPR